MRLPESLRGFAGAGMLSQEDEACAAKLDEKIRRACEGASYPDFTQMLNDNQQAMARHILASRRMDEYAFRGGFDGAERRMLGLNCGEHARFPITSLQLIPRSGGVLNHRDYLGAMLSLGMKRELIGDILIVEGGAVVFVCDGAVDFIKLNLEKAANTRLDVAELSEGGLEQALGTVRADYEIIHDTVASLRLDAVVAAAVNCSRAQAQALVASERVQVNHLACRDSDRAIDAGALLSVRGYGRYRLDEAGDLNRRGRIRITIKKYL